MPPSLLLLGAIVTLAALQNAAVAVDSDVPCERRDGDVTNSPFTNQAEGQRSARCLAVCSQEVTGIEDALVSSFGVWTSLDGTLLQSQSCPRFYEVKECQLGCLLRSSETSDNDCRDTCLEQCEDSCLATMSCRGPCTDNRNCRRRLCLNGCETATQLDGTTDPASVPATPGGFTLEPVLEGAGLFNATSVNTSQLSPEANTSVFLWRVEAADDTLYVLQSSLTEFLDLSFFSCQTVSLSLAVVNRHRSSQFTPPTSLCVHGGPPSAPRNIQQISTVDDPRPGFLGHAIINLVWKQPQNGFALVTGYEMTVVPRPLPPFPDDQCGNRTTYPISKDATSYELRAEEVGDIPQFGPQEGKSCSYIVLLQSLPMSPENSERENVIPALTSPLAPTVTSSYDKIADPLTGLVGASTSFSYEYNPLIEEAIFSYAVDILNVEVNGVPGFPVISLTYNSTLDILSEMLGTSAECPGEGVSVTINTTLENDRVLVKVFVRDLCIMEQRNPDDFSSNYQLSLTALFDPTNIWWRPVPMFPSVKLEGTTEAPTPVLPDTIRVLEEPPLELVNLGDSQYEVSFGLVWEPPLLIYGAEEYEVYVGGQPISEEISNEFVVTTQQGQTNATLTKIIELQDEHQVYVQIRSSNGFLVSNWSAPVDIIDSTPPPPDGGSPPPPDGGSLSTPVIAAIVVGVVVALAVVLIVALAVPLCLNHRRKSRLLKSLEGDADGTFSLSYRGLQRGRSNQDLIRKLLPMDDEWEIPPITLEVEKQLGEGAFGEVYKGVIRGPIPGSRTMKDSIGSVVAIKYLKGKANPSERKDFVNEIEMMKRVAMGANPHVVGLIGCVTREEPLCLIIEYLKYGDLRSYLHSIKEELGMKRYVKKLQAVDTPHPDAYADGGYVTEIGGGDKDGEGEGESGYENTPQPYMKPVRTEAYPYLQPVSAVAMSEESPYASLGDVEPVNLVSFAFQIAAGMEYLSSLEIVHRDLACRNVLVGEGKALKIADFGLSRVVSEGDAYVKTTSGRLPIKWMAIESINDRIFTVQSDVWAFGVVVWEIATLGGFPYPSIRNEELREYLLHGNRLEKPPNCADAIYELMQQCWMENPAKRPLFSELRASFESVLMEASSYIQFSSLTDITASKEPPPPRHLPVTTKASNPYVSNPKRTGKSGQTTPLDTPTDGSANTPSPSEVESVKVGSGEPLQSPAVDGATSSYTTVLPGPPQPN